MISVMLVWLVVAGLLAGLGLSGYAAERADALSAVTRERAEYHVGEARSAARFTLLAPFWPVSALVLLVRYGVPALVVFVRVAMPEQPSVKRARRIRELEKELGYLRGESDG